MNLMRHYIYLYFLFLSSQTHYLTLKNNLALTSTMRSSGVAIQY